MGHNEALNLSFLDGFAKKDETGVANFIVAKIEILNGGGSMRF